jgi:hypothetical protein
MRKGFLVIQVVAACFAVQVGVAAAGGISDTGPGCGLGKVAWQDAKVDTNTVGAQLLISTTNNTILPWQAFGITTGIFGCRNNGKVWAEQKVHMFAQLNVENLSQEMAQGGGEHLGSMATLMGIPVEHQAEFFALTQERYSSLVNAGEASPVAMVKALNDAIATRPVLAGMSTR